MAITLKYLGHSCFQIGTLGKTLVIDPFISANELAKNIDLNSIPADYVLLSHGHQDHIADAETICKNTGAKLISNYEIVMWYKQKGIEGHPMNPGGNWDFDFGRVKMVNAIHSSSFPDGSYAGQAGGFVISNSETTFYFSGDTALTLDMQLIARTSPKLDFAILCIGDNFTMGYEDAILAAEFIDCNKIIACHYDTFAWIKINKQEVINAFKAKGKEIIFMNISEEQTL